MDQIKHMPALRRLLPGCIRVGCGHFRYSPLWFIIVGLTVPHLPAWTVHAWRPIGPHNLRPVRPAPEPLCIPTKPQVTLPVSELQAPQAPAVLLTAVDAADDNHLGIQNIHQHGQSPPQFFSPRGENLQGRWVTILGRFADRLGRDEASCSLSPQGGRTSGVQHRFRMGCDQSGDPAAAAQSLQRSRFAIPDRTVMPSRIWPISPAISFVPVYSRPFKIKPAPHACSECQNSMFFVPRPAPHLHSDKAHALASFWRPTGTRKRCLTGLTTSIPFQCGKFGGLWTSPSSLFNGLPRLMPIASTLAGAIAAELLKHIHHDG